MLIKGAHVFFEGEFRQLDVLIDGDTITKLGTNLSFPGEKLYRPGKLIIPGLIDIHTHGCKGGDFALSGEEEINKMTEFYAAHGTTSVAAAIVTVSRETCKNAMCTIRNVMEKGTTGCRILGINMEGPFLGAKRKGAQDSRFLEAPDDEYFDELENISGGNILIVSIDPDYANALTFIRKHCHEITVSLAHTAADYETAYGAFEAGAANLTHLFNGMVPLHHRAPGVPGAFVDFLAQTDRFITAEVIADGVHVHPAVIRMIFKLCGDNLVLISDSMSAAGLSDGEYTMGNVPVFVKDNKAILRDGTTAGSTSTLYDCMLNAVHFGVSPEAAIRSASELPARAIGMGDTLGKIKEGYQADFVIADSALCLDEVFIRGRRI